MSVLLHLVAAYALYFVLAFVVAHREARIAYRVENRRKWLMHYDRVQRERGLVIDRIEWDRRGVIVAAVWALPEGGECETRWTRKPDRWVDRGWERLA